MPQLLENVSNVESSIRFSQTPSLQLSQKKKQGLFIYETTKSQIFFYFKKGGKKQEDASYKSTQLVLKP